MKSIITPITGAMFTILFETPDARSGGGSGKAGAEAEAKTKTKAEKAKEPKAPKRGVGAVAMEAILNGATNKEALVAVREEFPDANTTKASINWYRNKLRKDGVMSTGGPWEGKPVPSGREMAKAEKAAQKGQGAEDAKASDNKPSNDPTA
jgi:hypothetical protein